MTVSKLYKLTHHQKSQQKQYALEDVAFCPKDFPFLLPGDVIEIYNPEEDAPRLLLKVTLKSLRDEFSQKDFISIEQSIANAFQLKSFSDVVVNSVNPDDVELDSVELTFKDQYLGRSEMWRLKNSLVDTCVYVNKKIEYCSSTIRCQVCELWSHGDKVSSGVITINTKIVFRSCTSMVYLFIQMSSEMWEFDIYGDLYFEKAVDGFLSELFAKWKKHGSNHEVTIVLFSRVLYSASSLEQFPEPMRDCLQIDYKGRFYEDFYRVAVQNERYEDWGGTLILLRRLFVDYQNNLLNMHHKFNRNSRIPKSRISSAAEGNFLEVLNMSLNVFEKHFMDRSFDRTGQLSVVITPGVGVFEVDRDLTNVTMQRIIDNGVGSDLVCVGEQPLHAVPLLKFHNKDTAFSGSEDYSMPHWINLSFYSANKKVGYSSYVPRIKLPVTSQDSIKSHNEEWDWGAPTRISIPRGKSNAEESTWPNSVYDFDDYDSNVFRLPNSQSLHRRSLQRKRIRRVDIQPNVFRRQNSEPEMHHSSDFTPIRNPSLTSIGSDREKSLPTLSLASSASAAITIPAKQKLMSIDNFVSSSFGALNIETKSRLDGSHREHMFTDDLWINTQKALSPGTSSHGSSPSDKKMVYSRQQKENRRRNRALINPFDPSHAVIKLTSNRRRWTHIFPRGPSGALIQQHHYHAAQSNLEIVHEGVNYTENGSPARNGTEGKPRSRGSMTRQSSDGNLGNRMLTLLWGATGEQGWSPALTTGVDWKSLTIPACLPITTDYFPDERSLQIDYLVSAYNLLPDYVNSDDVQHRAATRIPLTTKQVFLEIVSQRLAQGFQLIVRIKDDKADKNVSLNSSFLGSNTIRDDSEEFLLSIGRIFHRILLSGSTITVTTYRPRHPYPSIKIHYRYRFLAPHNHNNYEASWADFMTEKLEHYKWNYLDNYICARGDHDFILIEPLKYWRFRMFLLPTVQTAAKKILEGSEHANVYVALTEEEKATLIDGFLKFIETCINRIRRPNNSAKAITRTPTAGVPIQSGSGFRERVNSNRLGERPRPRSGSKSTEKWSGGRSDGSGNTSGRISPVDSLLNDAKVVTTAASDTLSDIVTAGLSSECSEEVPCTKLKSNTSLRGIIDAMCSQNNGFSFIKSSDLPPWTFVSSDAVAWLISHMEGIQTEKNAVQKFSEMVEERLISHGSRDSRHPFLNGFYLYFIISDPGNSRDNDVGLPDGNLSLFQNEWMEVEVESVPKNGTTDSSSEQTATTLGNKPSSPIPAATQNTTEKNSNVRSGTLSKGRKKTSQYKQVYVEVDVGKKSDRPEWGHVRYQSVYRPWEAFELNIQWIQATGSIITELVQGWSRKAQQCNMQLVPIPSDPFALPYASKSDSLRGPIFIPLNIESLLENRSYLFEAYPEETWSSRMLMLQEAIIFKFGFMPSPVDSRTHSTASHSRATTADSIIHHHYVHSSGNMFVLIPSNSSSVGIGIKDSLAGFHKSYDSPIASSYDDYITRHVSGKNKNTFSEDNRVGFLWSWNYMVSKRWKTSSTPALGDENFMFRVLRDFECFCANELNRLKTYWQEYQANMSSA